MNRLARTAINRAGEELNDEVSFVADAYHVFNTEKGIDLYMTEENLSQEARTEILSRREQIDKLVDECVNILIMDSKVNEEHKELIEA